MSLGFYSISHHENSPSVLQPADAGWIDGYRFGHRLLKGVMFKISIDFDGALIADLDAEGEAYFASIGLEKSHWLEEALKYAQLAGFFASSPTQSNDDIVLYDDNRPFDEQMGLYFEIEPVIETGETADEAQISDPIIDSDAGCANVTEEAISQAYDQGFESGAEHALGYKVPIENPHPENDPRRDAWSCAYRQGYAAEQS